MQFFGGSYIFFNFFCDMHVDSTTKSNFIVFNNESWKRFVDFASKWVNYDCKESDIVTEIATKLGIDFHDTATCIAAQPSPSSNIGYHYNCCKHFCDISKIRRKEKSFAKKYTSQGQGMCKLIHHALIMTLKLTDVTLDWTCE